MAHPFFILWNILLLVYRILEHLVLLFVPNSFRFKDIEGQIALVTGGGSGIGRLVSVGLSRKGAKVVVWDLNRESADETCKIIRQGGGQAFSYVCDVSSAKSVNATAEKVRADVGKVSILVNNAGIVFGKSLLELKDDQIEKIFAVNALAHFWTCKAFLPDMMVNNKGHIVAIASLAGLMGLDKLTDYCATKHAVTGFSQSLTLELRKGGYDGVHITTVCPFVVTTGFFEGFNGGILPALSPEYVAQQIISAMLVNQRLLVLPKLINIILLLQSILPLEAQLCLADIFEAEKMMANFKGRGTNAQQQEIKTN